MLHPKKNYTDDLADIFINQRNKFGSKKSLVMLYQNNSLKRP